MKPGLNYLVYHHLTNYISLLKHGGGSILAELIFKAAGTGRLVRFEKKISISHFILGGDPAQDYSFEQSFTFKYNSDPTKHSKENTGVALGQVCECPSVIQPEPGHEPD